MWWPFQWLFIYILGGFTCIPVLIGLAIWWVMTYGSVPLGDDDPLKRAKVRLQRQHNAGVGTASKEDTAGAEGIKRSFAGYLTVRRQFRQNTSNTSFLFGPSTDLSGAEVKEDDQSDDGSIKDGKSSAAPSPTSAAPTVSQRLVGAYKQVRKTQAAPPKELFYCVLKGSVLFLYDDDKQTDCVAAISIEKYTVGMEKPEMGTTKSKPFDGKDGEMFGKRNACVMRLVEKEKVGKGEEKEKKGLPVLARGMTDGDSTLTAKEREHHEEMENAPWFFFCTRNIEMEDLYIALVQVSSAHPTITDVFSFAGMKQLVDTIDKEPDPLSTRWLNAFVGRIFLSLNQTRQIEDKIIAKIKLKLTKVQRPAWLGEIIINEVHVGKTPPIFYRPMLKDLTPAGGAAMEIGLKYRTDPLDEDSGVRFIASTQAIIPLGYKQVTVNIMVEARLKTLEGNVLLKIKEPPSNRIWWGFTSPPKLEVEIKPVVQDRKLNLAVVLNQLDSLLRRVIAESIVLPAMDDLAFFDTSTFDVRGGIFSEASKYRSTPHVPETDIAAEVKAPEEVLTSHEDPSSATAETPTLRKRVPSKAATMDHGVKKEEPIRGISRVDTAPANLDAAAAAAKRSSGLDKWFSPAPSITQAAEKEASSTTASVPKPSLPSNGAASASAPSLVIPLTAEPSRDPSPPSKPPTPVSISPADAQRISIDTSSADTASLASTSSTRTLGAGSITTAGTDGVSPATSSAALLSAVKQFRAGDKKALQDITKTGMDGVKKGWMSFAAKRKGAPPSPERDIRPAKAVPYRPVEDERDAAAGISFGRATGHRGSEGESGRSLDDRGRSLKERLDAAAHAASLASSPPPSTVPVPSSNGRSRSGTDASKTSSIGPKPSLLSSPSKMSVPTLSPTIPVGEQWTPVVRASTSDSPAGPSDGARRPSTDSIASASGSVTHQPVSVQPGMGRGMVVPRVPKRPGEVTGLGSSPGIGIIRRVSHEIERGQEVLVDTKEGEAEKTKTSSGSSSRSSTKAPIARVPVPPLDPAGVAALDADRVAALDHSPIPHAGPPGDLASAIEADLAVPHVKPDVAEPQGSGEGSSSGEKLPSLSSAALGVNGDLASAIQADTATPPLLPERRPRPATPTPLDDAPSIPPTLPERRDTSTTIDPTQNTLPNPPTLPERKPPPTSSHLTYSSSISSQPEENVSEGDSPVKQSGGSTPRSEAEESLRRLARKESA